MTGYNRETQSNKPSLRKWQRIGEVRSDLELPRQRGEEECSALKEQHLQSPYR